MSKKYYGVSWVIEQIERSREYPDRYVSHKNFTNEDTLYHCQTCSLSWEMVKGPKIEFYQDFPSFGLKKKQCHRCDEQL